MYKKFSKQKNAACLRKLGIDTESPSDPGGSISFDEWLQQVDSLCERHEVLKLSPTMSEAEWREMWESGDDPFEAFCECIRD